MCLKIVGREGESKVIKAQGTSVKEYTSKRVQNYRENSLLFQENLMVCSVDQEFRVKFLVPWNIKI